MASFSLADPPTNLAAVRQAHGVTLEGLVRDHAAFVWRSVRRLGVPAADVDDVTQTVFLKVRERLGELTPESARGALYRLALGLSSNHKRSVSRRREVDIEDESVRTVDRSAMGRNPSTQVEQRQLLDKLLEPLAIDLRAVLVLHEAEELTVPEIAELLDIPTGTAASRLRRAREEVKLSLARLKLRDSANGGGS
ncbi:MAG: sigma-70 family RNA polymerase sigma factor [Polyangiaceae bacterium]|nr:sigma-70 family RNA polymerase sigma factor [Polyangiaceae bacterium]